LEVVPLVADFNGLRPQTFDFSVVRQIFFDVGRSPLIYPFLAANRGCSATSRRTSVKQNGLPLFGPIDWLMGQDGLCHFIHQLFDEDQPAVAVDIWAMKICKFREKGVQRISSGACRAKEGSGLSWPADARRGHSRSAPAFEADRGAVVFLAISAGRRCFVAWQRKDL
jgi:hypothetical protein